MEYNIREEVFGGTLINLENGKRTYVNKQELKKILEENEFPSDIPTNINQKNNIKFTHLDVKNLNHFSFADIAFIEVTRACNLRCKHCLNNSGKIMDNQLTTEEIISLIEKLAKAGIQEIRFTGGEPLTHKDIYKMIETAAKLGIYTSIGTNGTLIDEQTAIKLKEAGLKKAVVSIDGPKEKHDDIRGKGNYEKTIAGIKYLQEQGIKIKVNSVIMRSNMEDVILLAKELNKLKIDLLIRRFIESGRGENLENNILSKEDYDYVREKLDYELKSAPYVRGHYIRLNDEASNTRIELPFEIKKGCKAGQRALVITPNGDIHFCGFLAAQNFPAIGNARNIESWNKFWNDLQKQNKLTVLEKNLERYNKIPHIQPTNCLAYVQRMINLENSKEKEG
jgi:MoaA/NifB/PqqE/SkfB family radical SAM enzyme